MKDIKAILAEVELDDSAKESIIKAVGENYRTVEEVEKKTKRIADLEEQNQTLTDQVAAIEGDGEELEKLRRQVADYTEAEKKRKADEKEAQKRADFKAVFDASLDGKEFANEIVMQSVFEKAYEQCSAKTGLNASEVIEEITKDAEGIWKNPQQTANKLPDPAQVSTENANEKAAKRTIAQFMFPSKE